LAEPRRALTNSQTIPRPSQNYSKVTIPRIAEEAPGLAEIPVTNGRSHTGRPSQPSSDQKEKSGADLDDNGGDPGRPFRPRGIQGLRRRKPAEFATGCVRDQFSPKRPRCEAVQAKRPAAISRHFDVTPSAPSAAEEMPGRAAAGAASAHLPDLGSSRLLRLFPPTSTPPRHFSRRPCIRGSKGYESPEAGAGARRTRVVFKSVKNEKNSPHNGPIPRLH